jgi:hypothetical protein
MTESKKTTVVQLVIIRKEMGQPTIMANPTELQLEITTLDRESV